MRSDSSCEVEALEALAGALHGVVRQVDPCERSRITARAALHDCRFPRRSRGRPSRAAIRSRSGDRTGSATRACTRSRSRKKRRSISAKNSRLNSGNPSCSFQSYRIGLCSHHVRFACCQLCACSASSGSAVGRRSHPEGSFSGSSHRHATSAPQEDPALIPEHVHVREVFVDAAAVEDLDGMRRMRAARAVEAIEEHPTTVPWALTASWMP